MKLQESGEMYLETILILSQERSSVRAIDVAEYMGFSKASVSRAVGILKKCGYLNLGANGSLVLTDAGNCRAQMIYERHTVLTAFLKEIGVSDTIAAEDACKLEHYMSNETFQAIRRQLKNPYGT